MRDARSAREKRDLRIIDRQLSTSSDKEREELVMRGGLARTVSKPSYENSKKGLICAEVHQLREDAVKDLLQTTTR